jgi:diaminohydroxyphosphoribosylaminopyrimidine deaminase/5-amino-6-(5-phosphoribosylamino)uracil reductase
MTILSKKGIEVACGVLGDKIRAINQPFIKYITKKMPYITLKIAQSLDGKIATKTGDSQWITSQAARKFAHKIRSNFDAIMVGINTVLRDNPRLDPTQKTKKFYKVVLDTNLKINPALRIFSGVSNSSVVIATSKESLIKKAKRVKDLVNRGAILLGIKKDSALLDIKDMLSKLAQLEITNILVEGGGRVAGSLLDKKLIDEVLFFVSPKIIGGSESISSIQGRGIEKISQAKELKDVKIKKIGEEVLVQGLLNKY